MPGEWALSTYFRAMLSRLKHVSDINSVYLRRSKSEIKTGAEIRGTHTTHGKVRPPITNMAGTAMTTVIPSSRRIFTRVRTFVHGPAAETNGNEQEWSNVNGYHSRAQHRIHVRTYRAQRLQ